MLEIKRAGVDLTESSKKNRRICSDEAETLDLLTSGDLHTDVISEEPIDSFSNSGQYVLNELSKEVTSKISRNVVSLALSDGHTVLYACSGIAVQCGRQATKFLTSASLVRAFNDKKGESPERLKIEVRRNGDVARGLFGHYNLDQGIALVYMMSVALGVHPVDLDHQVELLPCMKGWEGGPLFDYDGNFIGMNLSLVAERTSFMPRSKIIKWLEKFKPKVVKEFGTHKDENIKWPMQPMPYSTYARGVWSQLTEMGSHSLPRRVVSLASFNGERRVFACTGLVIEWNGCTPILTSASLVRDPKDGNKIAEKLKIEVLLPNNEYKEGKLQYCSLYYNVALVVVKDFLCLRPARIHEDWWNPIVLEDSNVVAVGRCFKSGRLMATHGIRTDWSGMLDCRDLRYSSCKITKAGIGGPLIDFKGRFVGMNFYDKKIGTPFLFRDCIIQVLTHFKEKRTVEVGTGKPMRWPVPIPCWRHPDDELKDLLPPGYGETSGRFGFTYVDGERVDND